ncbi:hypothetical protein INT47_012849 [Mucor saturninus]|uniref:PHD-type domain-containing protein n=1 Tax=Mucor saturninus TaxID=64648 RepID=A0A8H7QVX8_9FUNG|nr:hypothetical protein INT47_012849 [Mucor saturninus]
MDSQLNLIEKTQPKSEMFEEQRLNSEDLKSQVNNIRPISMDVHGTKRYSIPQNYKDSFYAIHHIHSPNPTTAVPMTTTVSSPENTEPLPKKKSISTATTTTTTTTMRGRKRQDLTKSTDRKRSRQHTTAANKARKSSLGDLISPTLYKTCVGLWPKEQHSLGDLGYDHIKALSNLLKVRLCQAKFKMMAKLDGDNELFTFLAEEYATPKHQSTPSIQFSGKKQNKSMAVVVGNGKNLFRRNNNCNPLDVLAPSTEEATATTPTGTGSGAAKTSKAAMIPPAASEATGGGGGEKPKKRKVGRPITTNVKAKRSKKKSATSDIVPVTLSDGTSVYVCEPCHKKYKNRNGLAYHLQRCKNSSSNKDEEDKSESIINCICSQNTDEHGTMVQCDKCRIWLHSECVGLTEEALDDSFHCANCKERIEKDLLQTLIDTQTTSDREEQSISSQDQISHHLQELFRTPKEDEEDDLMHAPLEYQDDCSEAGVPSSTQLHVWDDFSFSSTLEKSNNEAWNVLEEDYENDVPSSSWTMNDIGLFNQPPSLLFSDMSSAMEEETTTPLLSDLATPLPVTETTPVPVATPTSVTDTREATTPAPLHTADGLWFQFANFDDDYQCES